MSGVFDQHQGKSGVRGGTGVHGVWGIVTADGDVVSRSARSSVAPCLSPAATIPSPRVMAQTEQPWAIRPIHIPLRLKRSWVRFPGPTQEGDVNGLTGRRCGISALRKVWMVSRANPPRRLGRGMGVRHRQVPPDPRQLFLYWHSRSIDDSLSAAFPDRTE